MGIKITAFSADDFVNVKRVQMFCTSMKDGSKSLVVTEEQPDTSLSGIVHLMSVADEMYTLYDVTFDTESKEELEYILHHLSNYSNFPEDVNEMSVAISQLKSDYFNKYTSKHGVPENLDELRYFVKPVIVKDEMR